MRPWLILIWDKARSSFWFVPLLMMTCAAFSALSLTWVDNQVTIAKDGPMGWLVVNAATARSTLTLISGAMITLSGVVFSMTMVTLSLTSTQFGSRLLRTAMTDVATQVALGAFLSSSLFCLVVLRFIPVDADSPFVPHIAVFSGGLTTFASLVMMILFVHHIGVSIQAQNVVAEVAADLDAAIQRLFPEQIGTARTQDDGSTMENHPELGSQENDDDGFRSVVATSEGYLQTIDGEEIFDFACDNDLVLELLYRPGDFVIRGTPLVRLRNADHEQCELDEKQMEETLNLAFLTGRSRTPRQDVCCAINELVEVAVRALSPGINDPFTAIACIDRMTASLTRLLQRDVPSPYRYDENQQLRVVAMPVAIPDVINAAFRQIRHYGADDFIVAMRMMEGFDQLMAAASREKDRDAIREQADRLHELNSKRGESAEEEQQLKTLRDKIRDAGK